MWKKVIFNSDPSLSDRPLQVYVMGTGKGLVLEGNSRVWEAEEVRAGR